MTPKSRCRITAAALSETVDTKGPFAEEDARRRMELDALMAEDTTLANRIDGYRRGEETKKRREAPNLEGLRAAQRPGFCAICDEPVPPIPPNGGRQRRICLRLECEREYQSACDKDYRMRRKAGAK